MGEDKRRVYAGYARTNFGANRSAGCREIVDRTKKTEKHTVKQIPCPKDGATVLKVGGDNFARSARKKKFLTPHFLASGGGTNIA